MNLFSELRETVDDSDFCRRIDEVGETINMIDNILSVSTAFKPPKDDPSDDDLFKSVPIVLPLVRHPDSSDSSSEESCLACLIEDPVAEMRKHSVLDWSGKSIAQFDQAFQNTPKNFYEIAKHVDGKSVKDCVKYYYLTKKEGRYRQRRRKNQKSKKSIQTK
jgi:hypothetical protein